MSCQNSNTLISESKDVYASTLCLKNDGQCIWDKKGILDRFLECGISINVETYCETLLILRWTIQNKARFVILWDQLFNYCKQFLTTHSIALISSMWSLHLKKWFGLQHFENDDNWKIALLKLVQGSCCGFLQRCNMEAFEIM